jgi:hypothetical protein
VSGLCECGCGRKTRIATRTHAQSRQRKGEPLRFIHGHNNHPYKPPYIVEDRGFISPCWIWQRTKLRGRYGKATAPPGRSQLAHRVYYEDAHGPIPDGLTLDHLCRVPACVNPDHLEPVTQAENNRRGENTRLTEDSAREIRASTEPQARLAARFGVSVSAVSLVQRGKTWAT